jgi:hypothetical protein
MIPSLLSSKLENVILFEVEMLVRDADLSDGMKWERAGAL